MILMPVREYQSAHMTSVLFEVRKIGSDNVNTQQLGIGEHHAGVDNDNVVTVAQRHGVHAELAKAAQRNDPKLPISHKKRQSSTCDACKLLGESESSTG